jgi:putative hydrolase of the HAD superfamily
MIKAVFFDLYYTLVNYDPPREDRQAQALSNFGIVVKPVTLKRPITIADELMYSELAKVPFSKRSPEEKMGLYLKHQKTLMDEAGLTYTPDILKKVLGMLQRLEVKLALYEDVIPSLTGLRNRGIITGLISNVDQDISDMLNGLGLNKLIDIVVTSLNSGHNKPSPEIFYEALRRGGIINSEALYIGDQYTIDVAGGRGAGITSLLLDREGFYEEISDCPRIASLKEAENYL